MYIFFLKMRFLVVEIQPCKSVKMPMFISFFAVFTTTTPQPQPTNILQVPNLSIIITYKHIKNSIRARKGRRKVKRFFFVWRLWLWIWRAALLYQRSTLKTQVVYSQLKTRKTNTKKAPM